MNEHTLRLISKLQDRIESLEQSLDLANFKAKTILDIYQKSSKKHAADLAELKTGATANNSSDDIPAENECKPPYLKLVYSKINRS